MAWDVMSRVTKMAWDVMSGVTKTAWDVLSGVANLCGMFCPGCKKMAWDVLSRDVLSGSRRIYIPSESYRKSLIKYFTDRSKGVLLLWIFYINFFLTVPRQYFFCGSFMFFFCLVFAMPCAHLFIRAKQSGAEGPACEARL